MIINDRDKEWMPFNPFSVELGVESVSLERLIESTFERAFS